MMRKKTENPVGTLCLESKDNLDVRGAERQPDRTTAGKEQPTTTGVQ